MRRASCSIVLLGLAFDWLQGTHKFDPSPGGVVVTPAINEKGASVIATVGIGWKDLQSVDIAHAWSMPLRAADAQRRRHGDACFENEVATTRLHSSRILDRVLGNRLL